MDLLSYFYLLLIYIEIFLRSKQFIIRNWEEKTCYCFVAKADNKTELSKNNKNVTFPVFFLVFSKKEKIFRQIDMQTYMRSFCWKLYENFAQETVKLLPWHNLNTSMYLTTTCPVASQISLE